MGLGLPARRLRPGWKGNGAGRARAIREGGDKGRLGVAATMRHSFLGRSYRPMRGKNEPPV